MWAVAAYSTVMGRVSRTVRVTSWCCSSSTNSLAKTRGEIPSLRLSSLNRCGACSSSARIASFHLPLTTSSVSRTARYAARHSGEVGEVLSTGKGVMYESLIEGGRHERPPTAAG